MVYVGGPYHVDVFFSYAHGGDTRLREWSCEIPDALQREIRTSLRLKEGVTVFRDQDLDRTGKFAAELEENARGAAVLFVVLSDYYLESDWCINERRWFFDASQRYLGDENVVFIAHALPVKPDLWPSEFRGRLAFPFHDEDEAKTKPREELRPFGWVPSTRGKLEEAIVEVAGKIAIRLRRIKERTEALRAALAGFGTIDNNAIFLHAPPEDTNAWSHASTILGKGFVVVPTTAPVPASDPAAREDERRRRVELCAECDALLLLRSRPGDWIELELMRVGRRFRQEVHSQRGSAIPCAVLDLVGDPLPLADQLRIVRLATTQASMIDDVENWLRQIAQVQRAAS